jgi:hypothetical protein
MGLLAGLLTFGIALAVPAASPAAGYEVIDLQDPASIFDKAATPRRVAVIVLAYNDDWVSRTGVRLYESAVRGQLAKRYARLFVARHRKLDAAMVRRALKAALATGGKVDFMTNTHSSHRYVHLSGRHSATPAEMIRPVLDEAGGEAGARARAQLDFAANFGCDSDAQAKEWLELGFRSYVGHNSVSAGALSMSAFLKRWVQQCKDVTTAVAEANRHLLKTLGDNPVGRPIFDGMAGGRYKTLMVAFGENQSFCQP